MPPLRTCDCGTCSKCRHREYMRGYYRRNSEAGRETARRSRLRRIESVRECDRARLRDTRARNQAAYKARAAVNNALRDGKLVRQPCADCGAERVQAHHDDYAKPLDVTWLCSVHHGSRHRQEVSF